jgi:transcription elongation factor Elf1
MDPSENAKTPRFFECDVCLIVKRGTEGADGDMGYHVHKEGAASVVLCGKCEEQFRKRRELIGQLESNLYVGPSEPA